MPPRGWVVVPHVVVVLHAMEEPYAAEPYAEEPYAEEPYAAEPCAAPVAVGLPPAAHAVAACPLVAAPVPQGRRNHQASRWGHRWDGFRGGAHMEGRGCTVHPPPRLGRMRMQSRLPTSPRRRELRRASLSGAAAADTAECQEKRRHERSPHPNRSSAVGLFGHACAPPQPRTTCGSNGRAPTADRPG